MSERLFIGLDPSASSSKSSGISIINSVGKIIFLGKWFDVSELANIVRGLPNIYPMVAIDGPLQPPHELKPCCFSAEDSPCSHQQTTLFKGRYCEQLLIKRGFRCFVTSKNSFVKNWVARCFQLKDYLLGLGLDSIEVFPHASRKILLPELQGSKQNLLFRKSLQRALTRIGVKFLDGSRIFSHDELDAVLAALTNLLYAYGRTEKLGDDRDGYIYLPKSGITHLHDII